MPNIITTTIPWSTHLIDTHANINTIPTHMPIQEHSTMHLTKQTRVYKIWTKNKKLMGQIKDEGEEYLKALGGIELHGERLPIWTLGGRRWRGEKSRRRRCRKWAGSGEAWRRAGTRPKVRHQAQRRRTKCGARLQGAALSGPGPRGSTLAGA